ncbi:hypothetical protein J2W14_004132 [Pseudarthrobacter oxydans]|uniref:hypothetical protein n=1 Tax=Pseudarthrobacter oxydans TaxID=1671 RepID=UPI00277D5019|nr:hypothetical protein [Pseudarthrobacter oxydans]MDP9984705.1 hypothetical protein [Pseudarthrobacter oxydans]
MIRFQASHGPRPRARGLTLAVVLLLAASLAGCAPAQTALPHDSARHFQELVLGVSQSAAANDHAAALKSLDSLETDVATSAAGGNVSEERRRSIMTSITAVRADINAAIDAAASAKAAEETAAAAAAAEGETAMADAQAVTRAAQEYTAPVAPIPAPERKKGNEGKGNEGKGQNKNG